MMDFNNISALVTGGCGFIGSHLVEALVECGAHVTALDNLQSGMWENLAMVADRIRTVEMDVRDADLIQKIVEQIRPQYVFHLAANASVPKSVQDPGYDFETNCGGTFNLLNALRQAGGCQKIVFVSSGAVYGESRHFPITEEDPLHPISPYGNSKASAELVAKMFHTVYGLPVITVRAFNTYGPRMARFVILDFLRKLDANPLVLEILGNGSQVRDFTYVSDIVDGLLLSALRGREGETFNLSTGTSYSVAELAQKMFSVMGLEGKTQIIYTGKSWVGDVQYWEVSINKIRGIGYAPKITLEEGLLRTIDWYRSEGRIPLSSLNLGTELSSKNAG